MTATATPQHASSVGIRLVGLTKTYAGATEPAVADLDLDIPAGELIALVGPSGCGKTTTLKMINRLIEPTAGQILIGDESADARPVHELRRTIGTVIQQIGLFPHKTIGANIATVPRLLGWDDEAISARVDELVDLVDLDRSMLGRYPSALSGGQQQRVGVARALAADPPILLMDEPYSAVDPIVRGRLQDDLLELQRRLGKTIVLVTHDVDEAIKLADRVAILNVGGVLEQFDPPAALLAHPANDFVADFLGEDRGLKRLALLTVADLSPAPGPVVEIGAPSSEALDVAARHGTDWFAVRRDETLLGWRSAASLNGSVDDRDLRPFRSVVGTDTNLRAVLEGIVTSDTNVAVVIDGGCYVGMLDVADISGSGRVDPG